MVKQIISNFNPKMVRRVTSSIRFRLTGWYVVVLGIVLVLFGIGVYLVLFNTLHSSLDDLLRSRSEQLVASYNITDSQITSQEQDEAGSSIVIEGEIWLLLDPQGNLLQKQGKISGGDVTQLIGRAALKSQVQNQEAYENFKISSVNAASVTQQLDYRFFFTPVIENGRKVGELVLGRSREAVEETLYQLLLVLVLAAPVALLLSAVGGYWLAARAMRPVRTIMQAASEIEETDLSRRLNLKGREDELGLLAATFDRMIGRLEAAFNRQRQFTANASHELRTPLTIIDLEVNRALVRQRTIQEYQQALYIIKSENSYMSRLVRDLLTLARADARQVAFSTKELDLSDLTLEVVERLIPLAQQKEVELYTQELPELVVLGNRTYLTQMITNLVENAVKYTSGSGSWVRVNTGTQLGKWAFIRVADNGPGISAEHLPYLFDRFYRVDQARGRSEIEFEFEIEREISNPIKSKQTVSGSGLGLSIVNWVATSHGGEVKVESQLGVGTVFEVWLPLRELKTINYSRVS